ncbi:MAG: glucose-6-phosphate isomerase [Pseudobdellovibrio sp.]
MIKITTRKNRTKSQLHSDVENSFEQFKLRQDIGFVNLPFDQNALLESKKMASEILKNFSHLVLVGIGGSSMGPRALTEISHSSRISFLDNVDSAETEKVITNLNDLSKTAWLMISKSGSTIEVLWNLELINQIYSEANTPFWPNTFYITEETTSSLQQVAVKHHRPYLKIPLDVGGRFSVLSPVGLVTAEYLKLSATDILNGAQAALKDKTNIIECVAQYLESFKRKENITLFWFYNSNMRWFGSWLQQLWAESLGKKNTLTGGVATDFSTPMVSIGTCDQHSVLQQIIEGPKNKFVNIFRFNDVETSKYSVKKTSFPETEILRGLNYGELIKAEAIATEQALQLSEVSTLAFELDALDSKNIGFLFMFFQLVIATLGEHENINAFDQPGVALGKKLTLDYLKQSKSLL